MEVQHAQWALQPKQLWCLPQQINTLFAHLFCINYNFAMLFTACLRQQFILCTLNLSIFFFIPSFFYNHTPLHTEWSGIKLHQAKLLKKMRWSVAIKNVRVITAAVELCNFLFVFAQLQGAFDAFNIINFFYNNLVLYNPFVFNKKSSFIPTNICMKSTPSKTQKYLIGFFTTSMGEL